MSDLVAFDTGAWPWQPSGTAELQKVFHRFTIPLVGTFTQDGNHFLFWCIVGHAGPDQAWGYAHVDMGDCAALEEDAEGDFDHALEQVVAGRVVGFATANDEEGIRFFVDIEPPCSFYDVYAKGMDCVGERIQKASSEYEALVRAFPRMTPPGVAPSIGAHVEDVLSSL